MSKKNTKKENSNPVTNRPWLPFKTGLFLLGIVSVSLIIWIIATSNPEIPLWERVLWAIAFGASVWPVFFFFLLINRLLRKGK